MAKKKTEHPLGFGIVVMLIGLGGLVLAWKYGDLLPAVGTVLLGFIIGMLVGFFVQEADEWTQTAMVASVAVLTGAGTLALLRYGTHDTQGVWFYPIGLVIGFGFGTIWDAIDPP
jgi:tetrahydromethanopterin S-methyltransferase subunit C